MNPIICRACGGPIDKPDGRHCCDACREIGERWAETTMHAKDAAERISIEVPTITEANDVAHIVQNAIAAAIAEAVAPYRAELERLRDVVCEQDAAIIDELLK